jgi:UDP-glucose 4-epimerase
LQQPSARGETYIVADPTPLTLAEIVAALRTGEGRRSGLLPVPPVLIALAANTAGRGDDWQRIGGAMVASPTKLLQAGWKPMIDTRAGLAALTAAPR